MKDARLLIGLLGLALVGLVVQGLLLAGRLTSLEAATGATTAAPPPSTESAAIEARLGIVEAELSALRNDLRELRAAGSLPAASAPVAGADAASLEAAVDAVLERRKRAEERRDARHRATTFAGTLSRQGIPAEARDAALEALTDYFEGRQRVLRREAGDGEDAAMLQAALHARLEERLVEALGDSRGAAWLDALGRRPR